MRKLFRRLICRLGFHDWLTTHENTLASGAVVEIIEVIQKCGHCPVAQAVTWHEHTDTIELEPGKDFGAIGKRAQLGQHVALKVRNP